MQTKPKKDEMAINSQDKGKVGEREFAELLRSFGFEARRSQQYAGGHDSADITDNTGLHWEIKRVEKLNISQAVAQADADSGDKEWAVAHRRSREDWLVTIDAKHFLTLLKLIKNT